MDFFIGQIIPVAFAYAPKQTAMCDGQSLPINQYGALYALLGNAYGATGSTFNLPNIVGRTPIGFSTAGGQPMGATGGEATHTLTIAEIPSHSHTLGAVTNGSSGDSSVDATPATSSGPTYGAAANLVGLGGGPLATVGGGQSHENMQPSFAINFTIALTGIYPSRP